MTAYQMFAIVHGPGDAGSEREFNCLNPAVRLGWERLAIKVAKEKLAGFGQEQSNLGDPFESPGPFKHWSE